jgi:two-component system, cell cycle sensor histidine kinase and response regulator CckA
LDVYAVQGTIMVASVPPGGSFAPASGLQPEVPAVERPVERIMVIDDDQTLLRYASGVLTTAGFEVLEASSAEEAVRLCEQEHRPIHLILTDVVMPKVSGRQLASQLATLQPGAKVLLMSGYPIVSVLLSGTTNRPDCELLRKPFNPTELLAKVRQLLGSSGGTEPLA